MAECNERQCALDLLYWSKRRKFGAQHELSERIKMHCPHVRRDNESAIRHQGSSLNTKAEKQLIESLNALEPTLNTTWFNHFNQEIVVPEESALSRQDILDRSPFKSQRVHGVDLTDSGFVLKSYFLPAIRSELTGIEPQKIIFDGIRKLGSKNENFNCAVDILEKWMIPANGRLMEYWDTVSYDALDAEKARIKVYTGIFVDSLKRVCDIFTLGGLLEGDDIDKGIEFVKILWRDLVDLEPSSSQLKHCMQWVWEIRSDVRYPVPKLYFSAGEIEDHYVSDAVAKILQHIGWHEHVVTHKALMNEAWSMNKTKESFCAFSYVSVTCHPIKGPYITTYGIPNGPTPVYN